MKSKTILPAIRCNVGDWIYYVTSLTFEDIVAYIKDPDEIHERKRLAEWIQREIIESHADSIAIYIQEVKQRFLGAIIIGVYGGNPDWTPLEIKNGSNPLEVSHEQMEKVEGKLGLLHLSGNEKLFAIDGQHRVAGIRKALEKISRDSDIRQEDVCAIFVAHDDSSTAGKIRTRRLFTTVNKKAKPISKAAIIALDEDNGFAITTRNVIDKHWLFEDERGHISYKSTGSISAGNKTVITSVVGLFEIIRDIFPLRVKKKFEMQRPSDVELQRHFDLCMEYLDSLLENVDEYKDVFVRHLRTANEYREGNKNHLLFRPIGQRAFTKSIQLLISRGFSMMDAITILIGSNLYIDSKDWHYILWDPINQTMITNKLIIAETQLLALSDQRARSPKYAEKLHIFLESLNH